MNNPEYCIVLVTTGTKQEAEIIAKKLISDKLAACVTLLPVHSIYTWENEIHSDDEWQLFIKTKLTKFDELETTIKKLHSYQTPEIIALPILAGSVPYLNWISENVNSQ
ncbi:divalent-cation tolerance protein CutA [Ancylothrix sp. C2]|uniref:divalent-cation tolerance protein CutA n=1 Tax=Ancylothrix sp. D3o TaxID=2953691 RepID=UPI0021BAFEC4|nr:divalent-cation tolerance protein CutA [Ancylothrix sp. D3o]MCT7951390.1 divalent-cation tolerance protein CutA [Ancylothrix sp. D3o]